MNTVEQAPVYLDQTSSLEQLVNEVGPEIDREVDEVDELLQTLQGQLAAFRFAAAPITLKQQAIIQQSLDDCAQARAIQARLATFVSSVQTLERDEERDDPSGQINAMNGKVQEASGILAEEWGSQMSRYNKPFTFIKMIWLCIQICSAVYAVVGIAVCGVATTTRNWVPIVLSPLAYMLNLALLSYANKQSRQIDSSP